MINIAPDGWGWWMVDGGCGWWMWMVHVIVECVLNKG